LRSKWPDWIPKEARRSWLSITDLNKLAIIDGIKVFSYLSRKERLGKPVKHKIHNGSKRYRMLDIIARARAEAVSIEPIAEIKQKVEATAEKIKDDTSTHLVQHHVLSKSLTGKYMLIEEEIVEAANPIDKTNDCGVYFLVKDNRVVYVGQSTQIQARVREHEKTKIFDSYSFIACKKENLNVLESLYIHGLRPKNQGHSGPNGRLAAPYSFAQLVKMTKKGKTIEQPVSH